MLAGVVVESAELVGRLPVGPVGRSTRSSDNSVVAAARRVVPTIVRRPKRPRGAPACFFDRCSLFRNRRHGTVPRSFARPALIERETTRQGCWYRQVPGADIRSAIPACPADCAECLLLPRPYRTHLPPVADLYALTYRLARNSQLTRFNGTHSAHIPE